MRNFKLINLVLVLAIFHLDTFATNFGNSNGFLWGYIEWDISNSSWSGNPFDLVASATFTHSASGEVRTTEMFYDDNDTWKFRFTGTRTGQWSFSTSSSDPELNGHSGTVSVSSNPNSDIRGFLDINGSKFVRGSGDNGETEGIIPNIWMNYRTVFVGTSGDDQCGWTPVQYLPGNSSRWGSFLDQAWEHGCNGVQLLPQRDMMDMSTSEHNPNITNFRAIEQAITTAHNRAMFVQLFFWGDAARSWNPPDGINSTSDQRLFRYVAARFGPLPGWYVSLGFDLYEWAGETATEAWGAHLISKLGWYHPIGARKEGSFSANMDLYSTDYRISSNWYSGTLNEYTTGGNKPIEYSRRFAYLRDGVWSMTNTRQAFWGFAMAGGAASIWGHYPDACIAGNPASYPNPEQLKTHLLFWKNRFLSDMAPDNTKTDGYCLRTPDHKNYVFYKEGSSSVQIDLSSFSGTLQAIAIDCKSAYSEINITAQLSQYNQTWSAPHSSDWAISVTVIDRSPGTSPIPFIPIQIPQHIYDQYFPR